MYSHATEKVYVCVRYTDLPSFGVGKMTTLPEAPRNLLFARFAKWSSACQDQVIADAPQYDVETIVDLLDVWERRRIYAKEMPLMPGIYDKAEFVKKQRFMPWTFCDKDNTLDVQSVDMLVAVHCANVNGEYKHMGVGRVLTQAEFRILAHAEDFNRQILWMFVMNGTDDDDATDQTPAATITGDPSSGDVPTVSTDMTQTASPEQFDGPADSLVLSDTVQCQDD